MFMIHPKIVKIGKTPPNIIKFDPKALFNSESESFCTLPIKSNTIIKRKFSESGKSSTKDSITFDTKDTITE
ncbi:45099_t:CDS:2, partial [Gigaspora margarita]